MTLIKKGERVGVGAQIYSCLDCKQCNNDNETYCRHQIDTYGGIWPGTDTVLQGGYSSHIRAHEVCFDRSFEFNVAEVKTALGLPNTREA